MKEEKVSEFIERYTKDFEGKKFIDAVGAINELYSRIISIQNSIRDIHSAIGDICQWGDLIEKRLNTIEGIKKIEVVSEEDVKKILNDKRKI